MSCCDPRPTTKAPDTAVDPRAPHQPGTTVRRMHIGLGVTDLEAATAFYGALLDREPVARRPDHVKFVSADPPLNLALVPGTPVPAGAHFGIELPHAGDVERAAERLTAAGLAPRREDLVDCCYARMIRLWVDDPDGHAWELFHVLGAAPDAESAAPRDAHCCETP